MPILRKKNAKERFCSAHETQVPANRYLEDKGRQEGEGLILLDAANRIYAATERL
jgi:hypothetical protein